MGAHTTTDDPTRYRLASELEAWRLRDPIERVRSYLARTGQADAAFFEQVEAEADELARASCAPACLALPDPPPLALFDHVYAGANAILDAERAQYAAYLDGFEEEGAGDDAGSRSPGRSTRGCAGRWRPTPRS